MIVRIWRGSTRAKDADRYWEYISRTGVAGYESAPGNLGVLVLRRVDEAADRAEFLMLTRWESEAAVRRFAGADPDRAVFYPEDERYLVERGERVEHFELLHDGGAAKPP